MRATVMGLGLFDGGLAAARHLIRAGHDVTVTDLKDETALAPSVAKLADVPVTLHLGGHRDSDFTDTDLVVVNPAVKPGNRFLALAIRSGIRIDTEIGMFLRACPGRVCGVTGTAGKSTTSALIAACLAAADLPRWLGGNIGRSLLPRLDEIGRDDAVVLELSSFQLHWLRREGWRPEIGVFTNIAPNHLDWHVTMEAYLGDKIGIVPKAGGALVASAEDARVVAVAEAAACDVVWTSGGGVRRQDGPTVCWRDGRLVQSLPGAEALPVLDAGDVRLLGEHARANVASAAAAARLLGAPASAVREGVRGFDGLAHRLKPLGTFGGLLCVDDSKSTTPEATASAVRAFDRPVILLAGGYDKGADPAVLVAAASSAKAVVCYGATGPSLQRALVERHSTAGVTLVDTLVEAVDAAFRLSAQGDVLLLSPGHASWDQFTNYEHRAKVFADRVRR